MSLTERSYLNMDKVNRDSIERRLQSARSREAADALSRQVATFLRAEAIQMGQRVIDAEACACTVCDERRKLRTTLAAYLRTE